MKLKKQINIFFKKNQLIRSAKPMITWSRRTYLGNYNSTSLEVNSFMLNAHHDNPLKTSLLNRSHKIILFNFIQNQFLYLNYRNTCVRSFNCFSCCRRIVWVCLTILWDWCLKGSQGLCFLIFMQPKMLLMKVLYIMVNVDYLLKNFSFEKLW